MSEPVMNEVISNAPTTQRMPIAALATFPQFPKCLKFPVQVNGDPKQAFAYRHEGALKAFVNECPHLGVDLDFNPGDFFSEEQDDIVCSTHGALFSLEAGHCHFGPCRGQSLQTLDLIVDDGQVFLMVSE